MSSFVLLGWSLIPRAAVDSGRDLIKSDVAPAVHASGWLCSPDTTYHVRDLGDAARLTVVTQFDDAPDVREELTDFLGLPPSLETADDVLLATSAGWYRRALNCVTRVGLDVLDTGDLIPLSEYETFADPGEAAPRLSDFLSEVSATYRRTCSSYELTEAFWLDFFRKAPAPGLERSGELLWNLAG